MIFDLAGLFLVVTSSAFGFWRGGIKSLYSLFFFFLTLVLLLFLFPLLQNLGEPYVKSILLLNIGAGVIAYIAALLLILFIERIIPYPKVSILDRVLGTALGSIRGFLLCSTLFLICLIVSTESYLNAQNALQIAQAVVASPHPQWATESFCAELCSHFVTSIFETLNKEWVCKTLEKITF
jgi:uncharacterized membrane protein required for colicin V production